MGHRRYLKRIKSVKQKARSGKMNLINKILWIKLYYNVKCLELKNDEDWHKHQYFKNFNLDYSNIPDNIDRIDVNKVSIDEFIEKYEKPYKPCILLNSQNDWLAKEKWTLEVNYLFLFC